MKILSNGADLYLQRVLRQMKGQPMRMTATTNGDYELFYKNKLVVSLTHAFKLQVVDNCDIKKGQLMTISLTILDAATVRKTLENFYTNFSKRR